MMVDELYSEDKMKPMTPWIEGWARELICPFCRIPIKETNYGGACDECGSIFAYKESKDG